MATTSALHELSQLVDAFDGEMERQIRLLTDARSTFKQWQRLVQVPLAQI